MRTSYSRIATIIVMGWSMALTRAAENSALYLPRTEHSEGAISTLTLTQKGQVAHVRMPAASSSASLSFWLKWDRASDNTSGDNPVDRGNNILFSFRQMGTNTTAWGNYRRNEVLPADELWHYHLLTFQRTGTNLLATHYVDGLQSAAATRAGVGITNDFYVAIGAEIGLQVPVDENTWRWRSTDINFLLDDVTVWATADSSVSEKCRDIAYFGMIRFDPSDAAILHYYNCNTPQTIPWVTDDDRVLSAGTTPSTSWYDNADAAAVVLQDASEERKTKIQVDVTTAYGAGYVTPPPGAGIYPYDGTSQRFIEFTAPEFIYLDRYGREIGSSDSPDIESWLSEAFYRVRNTGYAIRRGSRTDVSGTARSFAQPATDDLDISWKWDLEYAVIIESATAQFEDDGFSEALGNPTLSEDGKTVPISPGRTWVRGGTTVKASIDGILYPDGNDGSRAASFRSTGYLTENSPNAPSRADRFVTLSNGEDHLRSDRPGIPFGSGKSFTLEFWASRDVSDFGTTGAIVAMDGLWVGYTADNGIRFGTGDAAWSSSFPDPGFGSEWRHWTYQYDESSRLMRIYFDGKLFHSASADLDRWNFSNIQTVLIGATFLDQGNVGDAFAGGINNVRLWNRALAADEIKAAMQTAEFGTGEPGLVLELTFDGEVQSQPDLFGQAAAFLDDDDSLVISSPPTLATNYTLEAWILLPLPATTIGNVPFLLGDNLVEIGSPISFLANGDVVAINGTNQTPAAFSIKGLGSGWHRFTTVVRGNDITYYVDGARAGTATLPISRRLVVAGSDGMGTQCGWVDDIRVWNTARSASAIANDWSSPLLLPQTNLLIYYTFDDGTAVNVAATGHNGTFEDGAKAGTPPVVVGGPAIFSSEGGSIPFLLRGFDSLFPSNASADDMWLTVLPTYSDKAQPAATRMNTEAFVVKDWLRVTWTWERTFRLQIDVSDNEFAPIPFIITERGTFSGVDSMDNVWVPEDSTVTVGTQYRTDDRCVTLATNGVSGQLDAFRAITMETLVDGVFNGKVTRQYTFPSIQGPGKLLFSYSATVFRAEIPIGEGFDASSTAAANAQLVPNLCGTQPQLAIGLQGGPSQVRTELAAGATSGSSWVWDGVANKFHPLVPGVYWLTWPDAVLRGTSYTLEITAAFPTDTITIDDRENEDGTRQNPPAYTTQVTFPGVSEAYPASPAAHYSYVYSSLQAQTPPVTLDPAPGDRWLFQRMPFAENPAMQLDSNARTFSSSAAGRAVMLYSYRPNPAEVANGDTTREAYLPRVVLCSSVSSNLQDEAQLSLPGGDRRALWIDGTRQLYGAPNASGGYYSIASDRPVSWESWVRLAGTNIDSDTDRIIFQIEVRTLNDLVQFGVRALSNTNNPGGLYLSRQATGSDSESFSFELEDVAIDSEWHHWAVIFDATETRFYRDGALVATSPGNPFPYHNDDATLHGQNTSPYYHTYGYSPQEPGSWLMGGLDNLRYWQRALTGVEVRRAMRRDLAPGFLPGFSYSFDQGTTNSQILKDADLPYEAGGNLVVVSTSGVSNPDPHALLTEDPCDFHVEVATRIQSKLDTAGFESGYILGEISNYNPEIYRRTADVGEWGAVYPVNWSGIFQTEDRVLRIAYYENPYLALPNSEDILHPDVAWPYVVVEYANVTYPLKGVHKDKRIYIASRLGTEGVSATGGAQPIFDPRIYKNLAIYNQPDSSQPGYNPNEEHALLAPSIQHELVGDPSPDLGQQAAFALQDGLNRADQTRPSSYTSEPWVLVEFVDGASGEPDMAAYRVEQIRNGTTLFPALDPETHLPTDSTGKPVPQPTNPTYAFDYPGFAGDLVSPPYPLNLVVGDTVMTLDVDGVPMRFDAVADTQLVDDGFQRAIWRDKNLNVWIASGDSGFVGRFWYPMRADFWLESNGIAVNEATPVAWLPGNGRYLTTDSPFPVPGTISFKTYWREDYPVLRRGETMTYVGGENKAENPLDAGLPGIIGWQSAQVVFDSRTPTMVFSEAEDFEDSTARTVRPLDRYATVFEQATFSRLLNGNGEPLTPASRDRVHVSGARWYFKELTGSLQKRFYFDSLLGELTFRGRLNDRESGDPDLTVTPINLYVLEPNVMTEGDKEALLELGAGNAEWEEAIEKLSELSLNPAGVANVTASGEELFLGGIQNGTVVQVTATFTNAAWHWSTNTVTDGFIPLDSLGTGAALTPNPTLLSEPAEEPLYLTLVENNHERASGAVALHILRVDDRRFRGAIKVVEAQDVFDEKINLRHTADFGGNTASTYYQWWVRDVTSLDNALLPGETVDWQLYQEGVGLNQIEFTGRPDVMMADKLFYVRYGQKEELDSIPGNNTESGTISQASWRLVDLNDADDDYARTNSAPVPYQWAGAANSPQLQADGTRRFVPQLVMGWVKRTLDRINPYEARYSETFSGDAPATFSSMIQQAGKPYVGKVALSAEKNVIENVGLIELYETILERARELTLEVPGMSNDGVNQALLLAATRLTVLYEILASEAYSDAQNPSLPVTDERGLPLPGENDLAAANPFTHAFENQVASLLHEELALLRGTDFVKAYPAYNRLFWNYAKGLGEAAYNLNYHITDIDQDGLINEFDAATLYPQGHGDAWGHYLAASRMHYSLLRHPAFTWKARSELYSLLDNVIPADFLDEKSFARIGAAKARTGAEIVRGTYRLAYTENPDGQWQGYTDSADPSRAWGVSEWAKRSGQAALFDWIAGNALLPAAPDENAEGLDRIDRIANELELGEIASALEQIQDTMDEANGGTNPLGLSDEALVFDVDPFYNGVSWERRTHFEQVWDRAVAAAQNAITALAFASRADLQLHRLAEDTRDLQIDAMEQDLDFRSSLIEIYGTPYEGAIGPGQIYEEGYEGPDTLLYMYLDRTTLVKLEPTVDPRFVTIERGLESLSKKWSVIDDGLIPRIPADSFNPESVRRLFEQFYLTEEFGELSLVGAGEHGTANSIYIEAPVIETSGFAFQAPVDWGSRSAYGAIQTTLNELLAAQYEVDLTVEAYNDYAKDMVVMNTRVRHQLSLLREKVKARNVSEGTLATLEALALVFEGLERAFADLSTAAWRQSQVVATAFPNVIGLAANDPFATARYAVKQAGLLTSAVSEENETLNAYLGFANAEAKAAIERIAENDQERLEDYGELLEILSEFGAEMNGEALVRHGIVSALQQVEILAQRIKALESEGARLQNRRAAFNMILASKAQQNRYRDMATRLTRNDALGQYQNAFENALRYAWLAARAYDYETGLPEGDPAAATTFLERIVKTRQLGLWDGSEPQTGNGGIAEILAQLKANFDVLRGQLGINNPQRETGQLSLRREHFRILPDASSDERWRQVLLGARVDDLWEVPEFRRFCRPFAPREAGAQPGIVIEFRTTIQQGQNVFGRPLAGGDNAYSSANYATKINAVGTWFDGYDTGELSSTPRIYLVPAGADMFRVSNGDSTDLRTWNILEQRIPLPYILNASHLTAPGFIPSIDGLDGSFSDIRRFGDFRAYFSPVGATIDASQLTTDSRLVGRSVWNTRWLLIIPGATLNVDPDAGLDALINSARDIKLLFETYSNTGM